MDTFKKLYIKDLTANDIDAETGAVYHTDIASIQATQAVGVATSAHPLIQPMRAAFYFASADGFGDWHILISTRADRNLREAKRRNKKLFDIILKKIKYVTCCILQ